MHRFEKLHFELVFVARVGSSNIERFRDRKFVMCKAVLVRVWLLCLRKIFAAVCIRPSWVRRTAISASYTLKIPTEDLMTGNLLSTAEIEPGSNNISHNEKKGTVSLWNFTSFSVVFNLQSNIFWTRSISRTTSLIISERFLLQVTSHRSRLQVTV